MRVSQEVMEVLDRSHIAGCTLTLPPGNLERKLYTSVNTVIEAAGGKWNRGKKCHVFQADAMETVEPILLTGEYTLTKQDFGQFDTPPAVVVEAVGKADIQAGMMVLEPSAGLGHLVEAVETLGGRVTAFEIDSVRAAVCMRDCKLAGGMNVRDFLSVEPTPVFDVVVMNPPFSKQADIDHVLHAAKFLKPGGRLVSIMSASVTFRTNAKTAAFRNFIDEHGGGYMSLSPGAFKESGTMVNAVLVWFTV